MDDPDGTLTIKNTIIANNIRRNSGYYVDFGFRQSGYGNIVDNGYNIVGVSHNYTWEGTGDWTDVNRDGTFVLYGTTTSGTIELEDSMSYNDNVSKTKTLSIASDSIAVDAGDSADNGSVSVPTADQRDFLREETPDIGAFEYLSPPSDSTAPVVFAISATPTTTTAVFEWTTNEAASSQVKYDPNQLNSTGTDIYNSDVGVTSHEVTLTGLVACTKYYYLVSSSDAAGNTSTSAEDNFVTLGCAGDAVASTVSETAALPEYGGIVNQTQGGLTIELDIPTGFAEDPTDFQIKGLESETVLDSLSSPTNYSSVGDSLFDIKALATPATTVEEFDSAVEVSMSYTEDDIAGLSEPSLKIYRNHDEEWSSLEDCTVDADANTVTCTTSNFSVLGLFGEVIAYEFTYIAGANGSLTGETAQEVEVGGDGSAVTAVPDANYSFVSWSDSSTENPRTDTSSSEELSLTAIFAINSYTLSYAAGANGSLIGTTSQTINYGADATAVTAVPSEGYIFASWSDSSTENPRTDTSISADLSVTASFIVDTTEAIIEFFGGGRTGLIINPGVVVEDETTSYLFVDTELHWAEDYIKNLYEEGVNSGRDETHFFPDDPITRAEFVKMVVMVMDYELLEDVLEPSFWDLNLDDWFTPYIETAKENGIIDGYGDSSFRPNIEITRGEALKIAVSAIYKGKLPEYEDTFNDVLPSDWFAPYVIYAFKNGIVTGYGDNEFGPANSMIRAEAAKIISLIK